MRLAILTLAALVTQPAAADLIDRVAVAVENSVITESEILRQIRLTALLNGDKPDFSPGNKRKTAERLVEQALIRREISVSRYLANAPESAEDDWREFRGKFTESAWSDLLREYTLTETEVRDAFRWQAALLDFIDARFRPGVQVSEEDIRDYFDTQLKNKEGLSFEQARDRIERILIEERVNAALDRWLGQARTQTRIRYKEEVFQ